MKMTKMEADTVSLNLIFKDMINKPLYILIVSAFFFVSVKY